MQPHPEQPADLGVVVEYHREHCLVLLDRGGREVVARPRVWDALEQQRINKALSKDGETVVVQQVAVGDRVQLTPLTQELYQIEDVEPRQTWLMRKGTVRYAHQFHLVAANAERLAVVVAPNPRVKLAVVDRYFLAARQGGLEPFLVVNKIDLDRGMPDAEEIRIYRALGYQVLYTSATRGDGLSELTAALKDRFTAFCGQSGVGKSSLLARLTGEQITVGETKRRTGSGRQTTNAARMYHLPGGGQVIDTPGIRVIGLGKLSWVEVHEYFADIAALSRRCRFADCTHTVEPDCAVGQAVERGALPAQRLKSYVKLRRECQGQKHW